MKPAVRGKYLVSEHAVELRRIIPALAIVVAATGILRTGGNETARADAGRLALLRYVTS